MWQRVVLEMMLQRYNFKLLQLLLQIHMLSLDNNLTIFIYIQGDFLSFQVLNILLVPRQGYDLYFMCGLRAICNGNTVIKACECRALKMC